MSAKQLIEIASQKKIAIGRKQSGHYYLTYQQNGQVVNENFFGTWNQFVGKVKRMPAK